MQDLFSVKGKIALVTGGSRGIGAMIAEGFVTHGVRTYISSRKADICHEMAESLSALGECIAIPADLSAHEGIQHLTTELRQRESGLDILVNNAGAVWGESIDSFPEQGWDKVMTINLKAPFFLTQALLDMLRKSGTADDPARVINIGSIDGLRVNPMETYSYAASKAGIHHLTKALARRLAREHITVNAVAPGPFESQMMRHSLDNFQAQIEASVPQGRIGKPGDMAGVALYLAAPAASYVTGAVIPVDGGISSCGSAGERAF